MEQKKYELTGETMNFFRRTLHRIRSLQAFSNMDAGDVGGWIEKENLSHNGNSWVCDNAQICGNARIYGEALVYGNAWVYGDAWVGDNAWVGGKAWVGGEALVGGNAWVCDNARVGGKAKIGGNARICGEAQIGGDARIYSDHHYWTSPRIGSRQDITTFYRSKERRIMVVCGCCHTDIEDFARRVKETHGDNQHAHDYERAIQMAKIWIDLEGDVGE